MHTLLLRLAGKAPDELIAQTRDWLAAGKREAVARAVAHVAIAQPIPLLEREIEVLAQSGVDAALLQGIEIAEHDAGPLYTFAEEGPGGSADPDRTDEALIAAVAGQPGVRGLWRAWRYALHDSPWPPPRRVYVAETDPDVDVVAVASALQSGGEQVEVFGGGGEPPAYQRMARAYAVLLWARDPEPEITVAPVFDVVDPQTGPAFHPGRARIEDAAERARIVTYLDAGTPLLVTTARMGDVVNPAAGDIVPMNFRTDGRWIWSDTITYYLQTHRLTPDANLLSHIRNAGYACPPVDGVAVHRTLGVLQGPWTREG